MNTLIIIAISVVAILIAVTAVVFAVLSVASSQVTVIEEPIEHVEPVITESGGGHTIDKTIQVQGSGYSVKYRIDGNAIITDSIFKEESNSVIITLDAITSGSLIIEIPRTLIDSGHTNCDPNYEREEPFAVLIDHEEVFFEEIATTSEKRTLSISFEENTKTIEIIAFCLI